MNDSIQNFVTTLERSGLTAGRDLQAFLDWYEANRAFDLPNHSSLDELMRSLVEHNWLTIWQCGKIARGQYKGFLLDHYLLMDFLGGMGNLRAYLAKDLTQEYTEAVIEISLPIPSDFADFPYLVKYTRRRNAAKQGPFVPY